MTRRFGGDNGYGWFSYVEDGVFVIGYSAPREGGEVYRGKYRGDNTPYLLSLKKDDLRQYNKIVKYFENIPKSDAETYKRHQAANSWNRMSVKFLIKYMQKTKSTLEAFEDLGQEASGLIDKQIEELKRLNTKYWMEE